MTAKDVLVALRAEIRADKTAFLPGFSQAYPGGYGEGDRFLGCVVPDQRKIARRFRELSRTEISKLLHSPWHECRLTGMFILVGQYERADKPKNPNREQERREIVDFYLANLHAANNWDIVDGSAPKILGRWLLDHRSERKLLKQLVRSNVLWERRVAVLATMPLIHHDQFDEILSMAKRLLKDEHDLMHKAVGWMLREIGKRNLSTLRDFLATHASRMPRTMLRYSIEKMSPAERKRWMNQ